MDGLVSAVTFGPVHSKFSISGDFKGSRLNVDIDRGRIDQLLLSCAVEALAALAIISQLKRHIWTSLTKDSL